MASISLIGIRVPPQVSEKIGSEILKCNIMDHYQVTYELEHKYLLEYLNPMLANPQYRDVLVRYCSFL